MQLSGDTSAPGRPGDTSAPGRPGDTVVAVGVPAWAGVLVGVVSMAAGLVVTELVAGVLSTDTSPVVEVGNRVVDLVPKPLRDWAISTFGTSDKAVLLAGVAVVLIAVSTAVGTLALRGRLAAAVAVLAAVVLLGGLSSLGRGGAGPIGLLATVLGGALSGLVLWRLADAARAHWLPIVRGITKVDVEYQLLFVSVFNACDFIRR